jgi:hypothetical protein
MLLRRAFAVGSLLLALLATSCATSGFKHSAAVTLELRFNTWDAVCISRPDTRENGFIPLFTAAEVPQQIERLNPVRGLAVVVVGYSYDQHQAWNIGAQWYQQLATLGFQRVVALRGSDELSIGGLPILYDSAISSGHDPRGFPPPYTATPPAARADAAHSPIAAIR